MDNSNETSICPDCGAIRFDYCGMQVCSECYHRAIEEMERESMTRHKYRSNGYSRDPSCSICGRESWDKIHGS